MKNSELVMDSDNTTVSLIDEPRVGKTRAGKRKKIQGTVGPADMLCSLKADATARDVSGGAYISMHEQKAVRGQTIISCCMCTVLWMVSAIT